MMQQTQIPADTDPANAIGQAAEVTPDEADINGEEDLTNDDIVKDDGLGEDDTEDEGLEEDEDGLTPLDKDTGQDLDADALTGQDDDREYDVRETIDKTTGL
ncbi:hypothetical protein PQU94_01980 [Asticcacaulis sp. DXS10W]|uniref:DNA primase n=1 Tax=Asticcacaulis currens TaxID=2984210 RepID=A0ABT5IA34_9CAUL|nr:hypothetical protein [Asticcacaulis currens]MDC7693045.1 hypothetical protein [Asticcacaulis currens]